MAKYPDPQGFDEIEHAYLVNGMDLILKQYQLRIKW